MGERGGGEEDSFSVDYCRIRKPIGFISLL